jgi:hypothetical protein
MTMSCHRSIKFCSREQEPRNFGARQSGCRLHGLDLTWNSHETESYLTSRPNKILVSADVLDADLSNLSRGKAPRALV